MGRGRRSLRPIEETICPIVTACLKLFPTPRRRASASLMKESRQILRNIHRPLSRGEVPAARKHGPALDVVNAFQIRAWWFTLGNLLISKNTKCRGRIDVAAVDRVPAIVPVVAHGRRD